MPTDVGIVRTAVPGLTTGSGAPLTLTASGATVVMDWYAAQVLNGYGWQVRAGTITTPLVGDVVVTDTAAEYYVNVANGGTLIPLTNTISIRLGTGTLHEYAVKSVAGAGTTNGFTPLALKTGAVTTGLDTAAVSAAGGVTVSAELATTTRRHWSFSQPIAMGAYVGEQQWEPLRPPVLQGTASAVQCLYVQIAATTTGPSYYAALDYLLIPTALIGQ